MAAEEGIIVGTLPLIYSDEVSKKLVKGGYEIFYKNWGNGKKRGFSEKERNARFFYCLEYQADTAIF